MPKDTYRSIIERIARYKSSSVTVFADFCRMAACALAAGSREDEYFEAIKTYNKEELLELSKALGLLIQEMEANPFTDILGPYYLEVASHSSKQTRGEFYTPPEICKMMARITIDTNAIIEKGQPFTINEPACGAGAIMLAVAEGFAPKHVDLVRVTCHDINPVAVDMCYINMTLWGVPAKIIQGNVLSSIPTDLIAKSWKNIHWHRVGEDQRQALKEVIELIKTPSCEKEETIKQTEPMPQQNSKQVEFDFNLDEARSSVSKNR